ncbi:MAG TPA: translocation/assembly module TamB domain-containing protein [Terriglobales bacterium]|nr:translocation/assembly module TamB domain-containing protein [Terriglobales bacterium]
MSAAPNLPPYYHEPPEKPRLVDQPARRRRWKRVAAWTAGILLFLILAAVLTVYVLLRNPSVHQYVLRTAQEKITAALGSQVRVRDYALNFNGISPSLDLYDVVVNGANPYPTPPLLTADHLHAGIRIVSLVSKTWYMDDVTVNHPVVHLFVDAHGTDNLPQTKSSGQKSSTSIFDLGVRHARVDNGEVYYNNRKSVMNADLHDLNFQSAFDPAQKKYSGTLSYKDGHLNLENFNPILHDLSAQFDVTAQEFKLTNAALNSGNSHFILNATLTDFVHPHLNATYQAVLDAGQIRKTLKNASLPIGILQADGSVEYQAKPDAPMLALIVVDGGLSSRALQVVTPTLRTNVRNIAARYTVRQGNLEVKNIYASLLGGELTGNLKIRDLVGKSQSHLVADLRGVDVAELKSMMNSPALKQVALKGKINANADATWGRTFDDLAAKTNATVKASIASANGNAPPVPLDGVIHASYVNATKLIALKDSYVRLPQTSLNLNGTVSDRSALQVRLQSNDLHELENIANQFRAPGSQPFGLAGTASFNGTVRGSMAAPHLNGALNASNLQVHGTQWKLLRTNVDASTNSASLRNGELVPADKGHITFDLSTGLRNWAFSNTSPIQVALNANNLNVGELAKAGGVTTPIKGTLAANVAVHGTELNPIGQGTINLTNAEIAAEPINSLNVNFNGTGEVVNAKLAARIPAGNANGNLVYYPKTQAYDLKLQAPSIQLAQLRTVKQRGMNLSGVLNLVANGHGTVQNPQLTASLQVPELVIDKQTVNAIALNANVANHVGTFDLNSQVLDTSIRGHGKVNLTGDYYADATLDTQTIPLATIVAAYAPAQAGKLSGQTELHATLRGPLKDKNRIEAHAQIPMLNMNYTNTVQIAAVSPIRVDLVNGVLSLQRAQLRGTGTDLAFQATVPMNNPNAPVSLLALGTVDLKLIELFDPDVVTSGQLKLNVNSYGNRANPDVQGHIQVINAGFAGGDIPLGLQNGNGVLTLTKDRLNINSFKGTVGGGEVTASGGVAYRPALNFNLALAGRGIRLLYPDGVRTGLGMSLTLTGNPNSALINGQVRINQLSFAPDFDLMEFVGQFSGDTVPAPAQGFADNVKLDITVAATNGINLTSRTLTLDGTANLEVRGTAADPVILGRLNLTGGDLILQGNRYILEGGTIDFVNPYQTRPVVNAAISTTIQEYNIMMRFDGPADRLHTSYTSVPSLPPSDIINLIAFGKTTEASAANPTPVGSLGPESLVASQVSSQVTSRLEKVAGISQLTIDPELGDNQQNPGARVAIQQRVTGNLFVTFATDVTETQDMTIRMEYRVSPRVSLSGTRDQTGGFGFLTKIHKSW